MPRTYLLACGLHTTRLLGRPSYLRPILAIHLSFLSLFLAFSPAVRSVTSLLPSFHSQPRYSITTMGAFAFHEAYHETGDVSMDESDSEQVDFDASDADLLELKQELNKLSPEKAQRDLADATVAAQETTLQRWKRLCLNFYAVPAAIRFVDRWGWLHLLVIQTLWLCTQGPLEINQVLFNHVLQRLPHLVLQDARSCPEVEYIWKRMEDLCIMTYAIK